MSRALWIFAGGALIGGFAVASHGADAAIFAAAAISALAQPATWATRRLQAPAASSEGEATAAPPAATASARNMLIKRRTREKTMILVTGATGNVGRELIRALVGAGQVVRALIRRDADRSTLPAGAEGVVGDLDRPETLSAALVGVRAVHLLSGYRDMPVLLAEARSAGVEHVVLQSSSAAPDGDMGNAVARYHILSEQAVRESGLPWTFLQPNSFMSNTLQWVPQLRDGDVVHAPFADVNHRYAREGGPVKSEGDPPDPKPVSAKARAGRGREPETREPKPVHKREVLKMPTVELTAGTLDYEDTGGEGPVLVLLGGVLMDGSVWDPMVADLRRDHRCVVPTLPLGAHRRPMHRDADLSLRGFGRMVAELLARLDLRDVTLVQNDHGAALALSAEHPRPGRVARLVISSCEAFENYPPGLPGKNLRLTAMAPGGLYLALQALRLRPLRRLPMTFGWMSKRPLPDDLVDGWLRGAQSERAVRRDLRKYLVGSRRREMLEICEQLRDFDRPTLVVWTPEDRVQRPEHGRRLVELLPDARLVEIPDSYTLIMRDQPRAFARAVRKFIAETPGVSALSARAKAS